MDAPTLFPALPEVPARTTKVREHDRRVTPRARSIDGPTAHLAAQSITPGRLEALILAVFNPGDELTPDEVADRLPGRNRPSVKTAIPRVEGLVVCGVGRSACDRPAQLWRLA